MKLEGTPKEIADFILAVQGRREGTYNFKLTEYTTNDIRQIFGLAPLEDE